ncbi:MAG: ROK family glucokinase [Clostridia bacterium]|nr:ROK family glucokinase [Clostridia bacterium]
MREYYFGIDVGGTTVKLGLYSEKNGWMDKWEIETRTENGGENILPDIAAAVKKAEEKHKIDHAAVAGIGIGVPGPVLQDGTVNGCVNLGWGIINVSQKLGELTGLPVYAANDANIAALGEQWKGAGSAYQSLALLTLGTGVGGGVILDGKIVAGVLGGAGEVGHMPVLTASQDSCNCGKDDCLELAGSATGLLRYAKHRLEESDLPSSMREIENLSAKDVCDCCAAGDALAGECIAHAAEALGTAIACIGCVLNPEAFLFGGGMAAAGDILLEPIRKVYNEKVFPPLRGTPVLQAILGNEAGITGGVRLVQVSQ